MSTAKARGIIFSNYPDKKSKYDVHKFDRRIFNSVQNEVWK